MSPEKEKLFKLEKTNRYVFHGSGEKLESLDPRQGYTYVDGKQIKDGSPAVFASSLVDYAIFMAIINKNNCPKGVYTSAGRSGDSKETASLKFRASRKTVEQLTDEALGYVYVFPISDFTLRDSGGIEYISYFSVKPKEVVWVRKSDLSEQIEIFEEEK